MRREKEGGGGEKDGSVDDQHRPFSLLFFRKDADLSLPSTPRDLTLNIHAP